MKNEYDELIETESVFKWWKTRRRIELTNKEKAQIIELSLANNNLRDLSSKYRVPYSVIMETLKLYIQKPIATNINQTSINLKSKL